jgi:hypothetical protein
MLGHHSSLLRGGLFHRRVILAGRCRVPRRPAVALAPTAAVGVGAVVLAHHFCHEGAWRTSWWDGETSFLLAMWVCEPEMVRRQVFIAGSGRESVGERARSDGMHDMNLRWRVLQRDGSLFYCKAATWASPLLSAEDEVRTMKHRYSHLPCSESYVQPAPSLVPYR